MKRRLLLLPLMLVSFLIMSASGTGGKFEGYLTFKIDYLEVPTEVQGMESMLPQKTTMHYKGSKVRIAQDVMGGSQIVIADSEAKTSSILMDMMGQKIHIPISKEEMEKMEGEQTDPKIEHLSGTKKILGYTCKQARITDPTSGDVTTVYYTDKLKGILHQDFKDLGGFPLEYTTSKDNIKMRLTATSVNEEKVADSMFDVPEGYTTMSQTQLQQMMGQ